MHLENAPPNKMAMMKFIVNNIHRLSINDCPHVYHSELKLYFKGTSYLM